MDSGKRGNHQRITLFPGPSIRFSRRRVNEDWSLESIGNHRSSTRNDELRSRRPIAGQSESGSGDSRPPLPPHRPVPSRYAAGSRREVPNKLLIVHGMERMAVNCDKVFNLFCVYGNVTAVKVLKGKQVLVELQDAEDAKRCVSMLNSLRLDEATELNVKYSKHSFIYDDRTPNTLSDGTPIQKSYLASKLNRFPKSPTSANRRRTAVPSKIVHFYNAPLDVCATKLHKTITDALGCADAIRSIAILPKKLSGAKCSTGLIEMKNIELAVKTIFILNHMKLESSKSKFPFLTKLCFSKWSEVRPTSTAGSLLLSVAHRMPWLLHKSEHAVPATKFPVQRSAVHRVTGDGRASWTLWEMGDNRDTTGAATSMAATSTAAASVASAAMVQVEKVQAVKMQAEKVQAEKVQVEKVQAEQVHVEKVQMEKVQAEEVHVEKLQAEKVQVEEIHVEEVHVKKLQAEKVQAEKVQADVEAAGAASARHEDQGDVVVQQRQGAAGNGANDAEKGPTVSVQ